MKTINQLIIFLVSVILFDIWLLLDSKSFLEDFYFLVKDVNTATGQIISKNVETGENETEENDMTKVYEYDFYIYNYQFNINKQLFTNSQESLEDYNSNVATIEYIEENPSINRIKHIAEINTPTKFFKEYILFKMFFILIIVWMIFSSYKDYKREKLTKLK